jgi:serine/threonine-protein kinase
VQNAEAPGLTGQLLDGRYQVGDQIGAGGMAIVYRATDTFSAETVAVKILLPDLLGDPVSMARLRREAELGAALAHRNVCHIIGRGRSASGLEYIVMPYLEGEPLWDRVNRSGNLSLEETTWVVRDVSAGLHVAHELGIIHRDLKPENVMLVPSADGSERAVLLDFGLAAAPVEHANRTKLTRAGMVVGTFEFMSPEQMMDKPVDRRSDVYALAFMAYELLTGQLPFAGDTPREQAIARSKGIVIPLRVARPDLELPAAVEKVLVRALAPDPAQRFPTAAAFGEAFARAAQPRSLMGRLFGRTG